MGQFGSGQSLCHSRVPDDASAVFCQGHRPVISSSREKLRNVRIATMTASTPRLLPTREPDALDADRDER